MQETTRIETGEVIVQHVTIGPGVLFGIFIAAAIIFLAANRAHHLLH
jgi:hypothetical protein